MLWITAALAAEVSLFETTLPTLHPLYAESLADRRAQELVFDWLFYRSPRDGAWMAPLLREQRSSADGRELTLVLRDDVTWHDGERLDAGDVCFTVKVLLDPATPEALSRPLRGALDNCSAEGHRAVIRWTRPWPDPREYLTFAVLPEHRFTGTALRRDAPFASAPIGTGPLRASLGRGVLRLVPHPNPHHDPSLLSSPALQIMVGEDSPLQVRALLLAPDVLGMVQVPPPYQAELASDPFSLLSYPMPGWWFVALETRRGPARDIRVRQALAATLDREALFEGTASLDPADLHAPSLLSGPFTPASPYCDSAIPQPRPDPERAAALMREAGATWEEGRRRWMLDGAPVRLEIGVQVGLPKELGRQLEAQLEKGGFEVEIFHLTSQDWLGFVQTGQGRSYDALVGR